MIRYLSPIREIAAYQSGTLPEGAVKLETPQTTAELMKKAAPIACVLCAVLSVIVFIRVFTAKALIFSPAAAIIGFLLGFCLSVVHEWLHAVVYPKEAAVTIGRLRGSLTFVALASYPLKRGRFILMCLLPFLLGIIPLTLFLLSPAEHRLLNGLLFGLSCPGIVSPYPDVYNVITVLRHAKRNDSILFHGNDLYIVRSQEGRP